MSYAVDLTPGFLSKLGQLPPDLAEHVLDEIDRLAHGPTAVSTPAPPTDEPFQQFRFGGPVVRPTYTFKIQFRYSQDEQTVHILTLEWYPTK